ncbi:MAG: hypothetical protein KY469_21960 [Actinobacteria bacterium]|nr:hypothetical protein [Actinomycetota bacterium]
MLTVARAAQQHNNVDLLEDVADVLLAAKANWDRYAQYRPVSSWVTGLDESEQHPVAAALRRNPRAIGWLVDYVSVDLDGTAILYAAVNSANVR